MRPKKEFLKATLLVSLLFILSGTAVADIVGLPTFHYPNDAVNDPIIYTTLRDPRASYRFTGTYADNIGIVTLTEPQVFSTSPGSLSGGYADSASKSLYEMYANAGSFDARSYNYAWTDGTQNAFVNTTAGVGNWFVLTGPAGPIDITADILIQGQMFANAAAGGNANAYFSAYMGFISSYDDLTQDCVLAFNAGIGGLGFGRLGTVDGISDINKDPGTDVWDFNYIIRSQPFTVTPGIPFRLNFAAGTAAFAGPGGAGEAYSNFYDPRLVTAYDFTNPELMPGGFALYDSGLYSNPASFGYSIKPVPEPSTLILLFTGLLGFWGFRRHLKK